MNQHLLEISQAVDDGALAVLIVDQAGWHVTPKLDVPDNITLLFLPPRSPELNPVQNVWQCLRDSCPTGSSKITRTSSPIAATHGTSWSLSRGRSCRLECVTGRTGFD
jgi:hypothetical protein